MMTNNPRILSNARIVVRELMSEPDALPLISACAVAGNGWQENLMEPVTTGPKDHGSDGLLQWRLSRLTELQKLPGWNTLPVQCRFFKMECKRDYPTLWDMLKHPDDRGKGQDWLLANLTLNICDMYERPSKAGRVPKKREQYAQEVMALFDDTATKPPAPIEIPPSLQPAVNGVGSSLAGLAALLYAAIQYSQHGQWGPWVAIGLVLVFWIGDKNKTGTSVADSPSPVETTEKTLDPELIPTMVRLLTALAPAIIKIVEEIPAIRSEFQAVAPELQALKDVTQQLAAHPTQDGSSPTDALKQLLSKVEQLGSAG